MWSLCLYKYHAMKGYGKEDLIQFNVLLGFWLNGGEWWASCLGDFLPGRNTLVTTG
jgi:hypothetical protein